MTTSKKQPAPTLMAKVYAKPAETEASNDSPTVSVTVLAPSPQCGHEGCTSLAVLHGMCTWHAAPAAKARGPWYTQVIERFPCDPEQRVFLTEQLTGALAWGGDDHMIRVPQGLFMAMLQDLRRDNIVIAETAN